MQGRGGRGRGGGQTRTYNSTVSLTNNNHYYCVITIREQRQFTEILLLIVKTTTIIKETFKQKCVVEESFLHKAKGRQSGTGKVKIQFSLRILCVV